MRGRDRQAVIAALAAHGISATTTSGNVVLRTDGRFFLASAAEGALVIHVYDSAFCRLGGDLPYRARQVSWLVDGTNRSGWLNGGYCGACRRCASVAPGVDRWRGRGWPERLAVELYRFVFGFGVGRGSSDV